MFEIRFIEHPLPVLLAFWAWGFVGAVIASAVRRGRIELPRLVVESDKHGKRRWIDPGFLGTAFLGGLIAAVVDNRPATAILAGISVAWCGRELIQPLVAKWLSGLGLRVTFQPPVTTPAKVAGAGVIPK